MAAKSVATEEVVEFVDALGPGISLFVQSTWSAALPENLPEGEGVVLCRVIACDGARCWEGALRRNDLSGHLGDSWGKPSNLRLLLDALAACGPASAAAPSSNSIASLAEGHEGDLAAAARRDMALPKSEAIWTCTEGEDAQLGLTVRFIYREGPVVAVRGVCLQRASLSAGLSHFFALAHAAQTAAAACIAASEDECAQLQKQQDLLQRHLEDLPKEAELDDERLLQEMARALNNQKLRCRKLWEAGCQAAAAEGPVVDRATMSLVEEPATISLEDCLDREPPLKELADNTSDGFAYSGGSASLVFASESLLQPLSAEAGGEGSAFTFTIPLTLGMGDYGSASLKTSVKRAATAESFLAPGVVRRKTTL